MTSEDWNDVRALFDRLVDLGPEERSAALASATHLTPPARAELERLLAAHGEASLLEDVRYADAGHWRRCLEPAVPPLPTGRRIGNYEIVRELARGGMGTVYEALQENPRRRVALKVLNRDVTSADTRQRFADEAAILARLHHPGIAQVLEAGTFAIPAPLGVAEAPYFAMEFLEGGRHWNDHGRAERLDLRARLALLVDVCDAVHYGHLQGVVHRDLKPSNVLIDEHGRPKIIDYGIAHWKAREGSGAATHPGQVLGTLGYISPEQLEGEPVTPAADVYSLGVLLYESLTDRRPFDLGSQSYASALTLLRTRTPPRPSRVRSGLPRDLDWIALRALHQDVRQRYESAFALAEDLRRFLAEEPVRAAPPSVRYRVGKFVARHRTPVALTALLVLSLGAGAVVSARGWSDAERERRTAEAAARRAQLESERYRELSRFLREALIQGLPGSRAGGRSLEAVLDWISREASRHYEQEPSSELELRATLARLYQGIGHAAPCEREVRRCLELVATNADAPDRERLALRIVLGDALADQGRHAEARTEFAAVLERAPALGPDGRSLAIDASLALAVADFRQRALTTSIDTFRALLEHDAASLAEGNRDLVALPTLALALSQTDREEDRREALELAREGFRRAGERFGREHYETLVCARALGDVLERSGRPEEALALLEPYLEFARHLLDRSHPELIRLQDTLSRAQTRRDRNAVPPQARTLLEETLAATEERYGPEDERTLRALNNLANHLLLLRDLDAVGPVLERLIRDGSRVLGSDDARMLIARRNLARYHARRDEPHRAREILSDVVAAYRAMDPVRHEDLLPALGQLADVERTCGRLADALTTLAAAIELARGLRGDDDAAVLRYRLEEARARYEHGDVAEAEIRARALLDEVLQRFPANDDLVAFAHGVLGSLYVHEERWEPGEYHLLAADERDARHFPPDHERRLAYAGLLVRVYRATHRLRELQVWRDRFEPGRNGASKHP